jgi:hypothetical protein
MATEDASAFADFITDLVFTPAPARNFAIANAHYFSPKNFGMGQRRSGNNRNIFLFISFACPKETNQTCLT